MMDLIIYIALCAFLVILVLAAIMTAVAGVFQIYDIIQDFIKWRSER